MQGKLIFSLLLAPLISSVMVTSAHAQNAQWVSRVRNIVASKQTYPSIAQMRGEEGTARVKIMVGANGSIEKIAMVSSSGAADLDREAMLLPHKIGTLPAPPGGATELTLPITWRLE